MMDHAETDRPDEDEMDQEATETEAEVEETEVDPLEEARAEAARYKDQLLRTAADLENYRKRARRDVEDAARRAKEDVLGLDFSEQRKKFFTCRRSFAILFFDLSILISNAYIFCFILKSFNVFIQ